MSMTGPNLFERVLVALNDALLDDAHWPNASALIDEACGSQGNILVSGEGGLGDDLKVFLARCCYRGERRADFEEEYFRRFHHIDERGPRLRRLPDSRIVSVRELYTDDEKRRSVAYNEMLVRSGTGNALHARLDGPNGSRIIWTAANPVDDAGWSSQRVETLARLLPHIRHYVRARLALVDARALGDTMTQLLENTRCGIVQLDARGRIVETNARASALLRRADGLRDTKGFLRARPTREDRALQGLLSRALPRFGAAAQGGYVVVTRALEPPTRLVVHVNPVNAGRAHERASRVAAIVLVVEPQTSGVADAKLVGEALGLTPTEAAVAVMLAQGSTLGEIAQATGRSTGTVRWHLNQVFAKLKVSRQFEVVQLVQSVSAFAPAGER